MMTRLDPLGLFVWFTISSKHAEEPLDVTRDQLQRWMAEANIEAAFAPTPARAVDAFRAATTGVSDEYDLPDRTEDGEEISTRVQLVIRETDKTADYVMRQVFRVWTSEGGKPVERRVADLQFFRPRRLTAGRVAGTERLRVLVDRRLEGLERVRVTALVKRCQRGYTLYQQRLSPHAMRAVVRAYLGACGGVPLVGSGGGEYVMSARHRTEAESLQEIIRRCGAGCDMRVMPLADEPDLRDMMIRSIDSDVAARASAMMRDMKDWAAQRPGATPSTTRWTAWRAEFRILQDLLLEYMEEFDAIFPHAGAALESLQELNDEMGRRVARARRSQ